jgi:hypothetical protein
MYVYRASDIRADLQLKYYVNSYKEMLTKECREKFVIYFTQVVNAMRIEAV